MDNKLIGFEGTREISIETKQEVIKKFQPMEMLKTHGHLKTVNDVVNEKGIALAGLVNNVGRDTLQAIVEVHIWNLNASMNLQNKLNEIQVVEIAMELMSLYYYLGMEDIFLVFRKAKRGEYGKIYGSLSMIDIFEWFNKYDQERMRIKINESTKHKHNDSTTRTSEKNAKAHHIDQLIDFKNKNNL
tara:strand:- start:71 stop:631 length:561 start_codon:yes stop_codon:yes gene_type:complete